MNKMQKSKTNVRTKRKAFTIVELVIVIAVIAILASVLIPTFSGIIEKANYSNAFQEAENLLKADAINYTSVNGGSVPDDTVYEVNGYYFKVVDNALVKIDEAEYKSLNTDIKNIIFLIPDGAGFGTYDIANALKKYNNGTAGVKNQATPITNNAIQGMTVNGLYLDEFMIATADTSMETPHNKDVNYPTDSAAAGTALLSGVKTNYLMVGVDSEMNPVANILELCRLEGKSTGFVTTKCLDNATPSDGMAHSLKRPDQDTSAYQEDVSLQILNCGIDVLLAYGTDGAYIKGHGGTTLHSQTGATNGYTVVHNKSELLTAVSNKATKLMSCVSNDYDCQGEYSNGSNILNTNDYQANHLKYDCYAQDGNLTLMDYAMAALTTLSQNINNEEGFCLIIEGGAIDNACEGRKVKEGVAEYLAFDEVFAYCVNWAMEDGETLVVACPDHDSGGFYTDPNSTSAPIKANANGNNYDTMDAVITALSNGTMADGTVLAGKAETHTDQNVPVWLYASEKVRTKFLNYLGIPLDASADTVRTGNYYDCTTINSAYSIDNSDLANAVAYAAGLMSMEEATEELFVDCSAYGSYNASTQTFTFTNGETVVRNTSYWTKGGTQHQFASGFAIYLTNPVKYTYEGSGSSYTGATTYNDANSAPNKFYVPKSALVEMGYISAN